MLLQATDLTVNFGTHQVLNGVNLRITNQSRIGLIGVNGAGKSTLLKCLTQEMIPQQGSVTISPHVHIQCLTQNPELTATNTLKEELYGVFTEIIAFKEEEAEILNKLENLSGEEFDEAILRLGFLQERLEHLDVGRIDEKIGRMITGLGFSLEELDRPVGKFSGGWQMRINLAKVLLQEADVILMDEPTNHLDMAACEWLEDFLKNYPKGILVVSHDRRFLDEVVTEIAELERGELTMYSANYTQYLEQREANRERQAAAAERQRKSLEEQRAFVDRFRASATKSTQAKSREKQLAKIEIIEAPKGELKKLFFKFPFPNPSGREVLKISNLAKSFGDHKLFSKVNADLEWSKEEPQRVFILGENGCGKTTLFKILMGLETPTEGSISFEERVILGYYAQHQLQILDPEKTVLETLEEAMPPTQRGEIRSILGRFLFSNDQVFKKVGLISGGEKGRLAMAKLMVTGPNTLLLDEPTNHLDMPSQEAVENALASYEGTAICISHDRYFINNHATQIWEFDNGRMIVFKGGYADYLKKRKNLLEESRMKAEKENTKSSNTVTEEPLPAGLQHIQERKQSKDEQKRLKNLEKNLKNLEAQKESLIKELSSPDIAKDFIALEKLSKELESIETKISEISSEWESLADKVEV
jgi:ATP-binding cassette subfamily F protein 3